MLSPLAGIVSSRLLQRIVTAQDTVEIKGTISYNVSCCVTCVFFLCFPEGAAVKGAGAGAGAAGRRRVPAARDDARV